MKSIQTTKERSEIMRRVKRKDTGPEMIVRKALHARGFRFKLHTADLPGTPDIVLPKYKTVVFVHGCFWHRHKHCSLASTPSSNIDFWNLKFIKNVERDSRKAEELVKLGWKVIVIWQCQLKKKIVDSTINAIEEQIKKP